MTGSRLSAAAVDDFSSMALWISRSPDRAFEWLSDFADDMACWLADTRAQRIRIEGGLWADILHRCVMANMPRGRGVPFLHCDVECGEVGQDPPVICLVRRDPLIFGASA